MSKCRNKLLAAVEADDVLSPEVTLAGDWTFFLIYFTLAQSPVLLLFGGWDFLMNLLLQCSASNQPCWKLRILLQPYNAQRLLLLETGTL